MEMHFKEIELDKWKTLEAWEDVVKWMKRERERLSSVTAVEVSRL